MARHGGGASALCGLAFTVGVAGLALLLERAWTRARGAGGGAAGPFQGSGGEQTTPSGAAPAADPPRGRSLSDSWVEVDGPEPPSPRGRGRERVVLPIGGGLGHEVEADVFVYSPSDEGSSGGEELDAEPLGSAALSARLGSMLQVASRRQRGDATVLHPAARGWAKRRIWDAETPLPSVQCCSPVFFGAVWSRRGEE